MERFDNAPEPKKTKTDFSKPDIDKQQRAISRDYFLKSGKVKQFDEAMRQVDTGTGSGGGALSAEARHQNILEGTVDKDVLAEASRRKMRVGGSRPLKEFVADVVRDRAVSDKEAA